MNKQKLDNFLSSQGAKEAYYRNIENPNFNGVVPPDIEDSICGAFKWALTPEGWDYWYTIDKMFFVELQKEA